MIAAIMIAIRNLGTGTQPRVVVLEALVNLLHLAPINVATCLSLLQPSQIGISLYHRINGLAYGLLINLFDIDANAFGGLDNKLPLSNQLALTQGFIGIAFTFGAEPGEVAFTLGVALIVQVLDSFKDDRTAAIENDVLAAVELGDLVQLVATTFRVRFPPALISVPT